VCAKPYRGKKELIKKLYAESTEKKCHEDRKNNHRCNIMETSMVEKIIKIRTHAHKMIIHEWSLPVNR
jgi:hypothetical protein